MRSSEQITDAASERRPILTDEDMKALAQGSVAENKNAWVIAENELDPSQKEQFWAEYKSAQQEQRRTSHPGEVFVKDRFGERSYPLFETVIPRWTEMTKEIAMLIPSIIEEGVGYAVEKGPLWPAHAYGDVGKFGSTFTVQLGKEMMASPTEEIKRLEALRDSTNDAEFQKGVQQNIDALWAEERPLWTLINDTFGDAYGYLDLRDPELFLEKLAYDSPQVVSDMAGIAAIVLTWGAAVPAIGKLQTGVKGMKFKQFAEKASRILDWVDPATSPFKAGQLGAKKAFGPSSPLMRSPMADETDTKMQDIARGLGVDDPTQELPLSQQNPSEKILNREMKERMNPLQSGTAMGRVETGYDAGLRERERLTDAANVNEMPLDAESAGSRALEAIDDTKFQTRAEANPLYAPLRDHGDTQFDAELGLEAKLQGLIDELKGSGQAVDPDARRAAEILEAELNHMRTRQAESIKGQAGDPDKVVSNDELTAINEMSLTSLRRLRTTFREKYRNAFLATDANKVTRIGENSQEAKVYGRITEILDEGIEHLESSGKIAPGTGDSIKAGDRLWRERAQLESTPGGEILFRHKNKPGALIDTILDSKTVTTEQLDNIYQLLGEDGTRDLKAALLNNIFERAKLTDDVMPAVKDRPSPGVLSGALAKVKSGHPPEFLGTMFDPETAEKLEELAYFMDGLMPAFKMKTGSQTYRGLLGVASTRLTAGGASGWAMHQALEIANDIMGGSGTDKALLTAVTLVGGMAGAYGAEKVIYSQATRKRILDGLELGPRQKAVLDGYMEAASQKYAKSAETVTRVSESGEKAKGSKDDDEGGDE